MNRRALLVLLLLLFLPSAAFSFDIWRHPEMAEKETVFVGGFAASFSFAELDAFFDSFEFSPEFFLDFMLPLPLPFSFGLSTDFFKPDSLSVGCRAGYHVNFDDPDLDAYVLYAVKFEFVQDTLAVLRWSPAIGARRRFGSFFCVNLEAGFMPAVFLVGLSIKLN
jgi:hypothetical protein